MTPPDTLKHRAALRAAILRAMADHEATHEERVIWNYQGAKNV